MESSTPCNQRLTDPSQKNEASSIGAATSSHFRVIRAFRGQLLSSRLHTALDRGLSTTKESI